MKEKIFILLALTSMIFVSGVSAYQLMCLGYGDILPPGSSDPRYVCHDDFCQVCATDSGFPTSPNICNHNALSCNYSASSGNLDADPPNIILTSPVNGGIYDSRRVQFILESDEPATLSYLDNIHGRGRWKKMASNIYEYSKGLRFREGFNNITLMARDRNGNALYIERTFRVDSKKPKITRVEPRRGFASGTFSVQFKEENPKSLTLFYGDLDSPLEKELDIENDCYLDRTKYMCDTDVDLTAFDGQEIGYWFELVDIADTSDDSKVYTLEVDTTAPVINNENDFFNVDGRRVYFEIDITEDNLDEVGYIDHSESRPRFKKLCSRLKDGICEKRKSFRSGHHELDIQVVDEAGNSISQTIEFDID